MGRKTAGAGPQNEDLRKNYYWEKIRHYGKRYPTFHWPSVELLLSLIHAYDVLYTHFEKRFAELGLSPSGFNILMILSRSDGKAYKQNELSKLLFVSRANMTGLMDSLIRQGLVTRETDPSDRRVCLSKITPRGEALIERMLPSHYQEMARVVSGIGSDDKRTMIAGFSKMLTSVVPKTKKIRP